MSNGFMLVLLRSGSFFLDEVVSQHQIAELWMIFANLFLGFCVLFLLRFTLRSCFFVDYFLNGMSVGAKLIFFGVRVILETGE
jgi:hypothetical protein